MSFLFKRSRTPAQDGADLLHDRLVEVIRQPVFYTAFDVPDTFEGRFDLLVLHAALAMRRLRDLGPEGQDLAQQLADTMFRRFDIAMRELGVSDVALPKRMKRLAEAFKGRTASYDAALGDADQDQLAAAVGRNVLGREAGAPGLARYAAAADAVLQDTAFDTLRQGRLSLPDPVPFAEARS